MGLKLAHALGAHVAAFTRSEGKAGEARKLGADEVILSSDEARMAEHRSSFDLIVRSEEHTSELQSLMRISYAVFCLKTKNQVSKLIHANLTINREHHTYQVYQL